AADPEGQRERQIVKRWLFRWRAGWRRCALVHGPLPFRSGNCRRRGKQPWPFSRQTDRGKEALGNDERRGVFLLIIIEKNHIVGLQALKLAKTDRQCAAAEADRQREPCRYRRLRFADLVESAADPHCKADAIRVQNTVYRL